MQFATHDSWYHKSLRVSAVVLAAVLAFESGLISPHTAGLADQTRWYVASVVGVQAGVEPNELNLITAALTERSHSLDEREAAIAQREIEVGITAGSSPSSGDSGTYVLSVILFVLLALILLNYALDFARMRQEQGRLLFGK